VKTLSPLVLTFSILAGAFPAAAYIEALYPLQQFISESDVIAEGVIEKVDAKRSLCTVRITKSIKGRCHYELVRLNIGPGQEWHPEAVMAKLVPGAPAVMFYNAERRAEIYVNRFFLQLSGDPTQAPERAWWTFTHIEIYCNRTFNGPVEELAMLLGDIEAGKAKPPPADPRVPVITKDAFRALPAWGQPVDPQKLPPPFVRREPLRAPKSRDPENPTGLERGLAFQYFEGSWEMLPDFDSLKPAASGVAEQFDLSKRKREAQYGLRFTGFVEIPREGTYRFTTRSLDGSKLLIGKDPVVVNDGVHAPREGSGEIVLKAGKHAITLLFFQKGDDAALDVFWEGPDLPKQRVPAAALSHPPAP
jgi:hypothetical protein